MSKTISPVPQTGITSRLVHSHVKVKTGAKLSDVLVWFGRGSTGSTISTGTDVPSGGSSTGVMEEGESWYMGYINTSIQTNLPPLFFSRSILHTSDLFRSSPSWIQDCIS